jgi:hypothetical protein
MTPGHAFIRHTCMQWRGLGRGPRTHRAPSSSMPVASSGIAADHDAHPETPRRPLVGLPTSPPYVRTHRGAKDSEFEPRDAVRPIAERLAHPIAASIAPR